MRKTFEQWFAKVKAEVALMGFHVLDLPDCPFYDWYEDGISPKAAAKKCLRNARE